jgi:F-type H+-transporting ATPase subunit alpha
LNQIRDFEKDLFELIKSSHSDIIESINSSGDLNDDTSSKLTSIIEEFKKNR